MRPLASQKVIAAWRAGKDAAPQGRAILSSWRLARMTPEQLSRLPTPPAPKRGPAYDAKQRQQIIRTILDLWPQEADDEDEYLEGIVRLGGWWAAGGSPVLAVDLTMLRRIEPAMPATSRTFVIRLVTA